jgi:hypothetical protein
MLDATIDPELSATFQIALVGCEGLVVGSDRRALYVDGRDWPCSNPRTEEVFFE